MLHPNLFRETELDLERSLPMEVTGDIFPYNNAANQEVFENDDDGGGSEDDTSDDEDDDMSSDDVSNEDEDEDEDGDGDGDEDVADAE
jgi:hypothetical protein